jgi:hypothetical protein
MPGDLAVTRDGRSERDLERLRVDHAQERQCRRHILDGRLREAILALSRGCVGMRFRVRLPAG